jgi:hypothetical protein
VIGAEAATALYAYAAVGPAGSALEDDLPVGLELIGTDEIAILVERVSLDEFAEDALRENLNDRQWLESKARRHEEAVQALLGKTTVVPLRFGSIHQDPEAVRAFLDERRSEFRQALTNLQNRVELGVKAWLVETAEGDAAAAAPTTGREYLNARRRARDDAAQASGRRAEILARAHERLLSLSEAGVLNRPQSPELSGRDEIMLMNAAYLVQIGDDRLAAEVGRLSVDEIAFELTGPWVPYNFVERVS